MNRRNLFKMLAASPFLGSVVVSPLLAEEARKAHIVSPEQDERPLLYVIDLAKQGAVCKTFGDSEKVDYIDNHWFCDADGEPKSPHSGDVFILVEVEQAAYIVGNIIF